MQIKFVVVLLNLTWLYGSFEKQIVNLNNVIFFKHVFEFVFI